MSAKKVAKLVRMLVVGAVLVGVPLAWINLAKASTIIAVTTTTDEDSGVGGVGAGCSLYEAGRAIATGAAYGGCVAPGPDHNVIQLPSGTYTQTMAFSLDVSTAPAAAYLTIQGNGSGSTTLDAQSTTPNSQSGSLYVKADNVSLTGLTVTGEVVLRIDGNNTTVSDLTMRTQGALNPFYGAALDIEGDYANLASVKLIYDNPVGDGSVRPYIYVGGTHATVNGLFIDGTANSNSVQSDGFETYGGHYDSISNVTITNTNGGLSLDGSFMAVDQVTITNTTSDGIYAHGNDSHFSNLNVSNITNGNGIGIYANDNYPANGSGTILQHVVVNNSVRDAIDLYDDSGYVHLLQPMLDDVQVSNVSSRDGIGLYTAGTQHLSNIQVTNAAHDGIGLFTSQNTPSTVTMDNIKVDQAGQQSLYLAMYPTDSLSLNHITATNSQGTNYYSVELDTIGTVTIANSNITNSPHGGGLALYGNCPNTTSITDTYIANNQGGSGIYSQCNDLTLDRVTVANNHGGYDGGGIYMQTDFTTNQTPLYLKMNNVTLFNNQATGAGGAIYIDDQSTNANTTVNPAYLWNNVTIAGNQAPEGDSVYIFSGGSSGPSPILTNSILSASGNNQCASNVALLPFSTGSIGNLSTDSSCLGITNVVSDAKLSSALATYSTAAQLGYNNQGGYLPVLALLSGSPAIDSANNSTCAAIDERNVSRPVGSGCDAGAYEFNDTLPTTASGGGQTIGAPNTGFGLRTASLGWAGLFVVASGAGLFAISKFGLLRKSR